MAGLRGSRRHFRRVSDEGAPEEARAKKSWRFFRISHILKNVRG